MSTRTQTQVKAAPKPTFTPVQGELLQRKCACGGAPGLTGECDDCRKKRLTSQHRSDNQAEPSTVPPIVQEVLRSPGQPLDAATRAFMEPRFGHDFSQVRVHTDARAAESARSVSARAYTVGHDVVFAEGQFDPSAEQGHKLLAHELTHTIQQSAYASAALTPHEPTVIEPAETALELAADESASRLVTNSGMSTPSPGIALQRAPAPQAKSAPALDESKRTSKEYAWSLGREDAARIQKSGKLSAEDKQDVINKMRFFQGEAKAAYIQMVQNVLLKYAPDEIIEITNVSALPAEALEVTCDIGKHQYLLQYEGEYWKNRCIDNRTDPEFLNNYVDRNIKGAEGFAVEGTTWENVEYDRFKVMLVKYKNGTSEYFMLNEVGDFHYAKTMAVTREFTYLKRENGPVYPVSEGKPYLTEFTTPNLLAYKNGLKHQIIELQRLYHLLQVAGTFANIMGDYSAVGGGPEPGFKSSLQGFTRLKSPRRTPTTDLSTTPTGRTGTDEPPPTPMQLPTKKPTKQAVKTKGEEARATVVSRTDEDPTGFKGEKKAPAKKGGKEEKEERTTKVAGKKEDEPEDPKGGKKRETADEPKKGSTAPQAVPVPEDPQRGVKAAIVRANQRIKGRQADIKKYNKEIAKARENEGSLREQAIKAKGDERKRLAAEQRKAKEELDELVAQRDHAADLNKDDQAIVIRFQKALDAKTYERPAFWAGKRDEVWQIALKEGNSRVLSPSGTEIKPGDPWVMGHKPKYESWKHQKSAAERGISREQYIKEYNDPKQYRPETPEDNASHKYEDKTDAYLGY